MGHDLQVNFVPGLIATTALWLALRLRLDPKTGEGPSWAMFLLGLAFTTPLLGLIDHQNISLAPSVPYWRSLLGGPLSGAGLYLFFHQRTTRARSMAYPLDAWALLGLLVFLLLGAFPVWLKRLAEAALAS